jgi:hypothetical protein
MFSRYPNGKIFNFALLSVQIRAVNLEQSEACKHGSTFVSIHKRMVSNNTSYDCCGSPTSGADSKLIVTPVITVPYHKQAISSNPSAINKIRRPLLFLTTDKGIMSYG